MLLVVPHLGTAIRVRKCGDFVDMFRKILLRLSFNDCGYIVDTAHGWNDPDIVADSDLAVCPPITLKISGSGRCERRGLPVVRISKHVPKSCFQIVCMDPGACSDRFFGKSNGASVFYDLFSFWNGGQGELVPLGNILGKYELF
jgi:hypothetical protein